MTMPAGATCEHPRMRCPNNPPCVEDCGHWWCPDCDLSWDDGFEGDPPLTEHCPFCGADAFVEFGDGYGCLRCLKVGLCPRP